MHPEQSKELERLRNQAELISNGELLADVVSLLIRRFPDVPREMVLFDHVPDQGEDFYIFVASDRMAYKIEIPRYQDNGEIVEMIPFQDFRRQAWSTDKNRRLDAIENLFWRAKS